MISSQQRLLTEQTDRKLREFKKIEKITTPDTGWINTVRKSLNMSLRQLGKRLNVSPQSIKEMESREATGHITLKSLSDTARALNMKLEYGFVPVNGSLENLIKKRAYEKAREIVMRTHATMTLENQQNSQQRITKAIENKAQEIIQKMPAYLWD